MRERAGRSGGTISGCTTGESAVVDCCWGRWRSRRGSPSVPPSTDPGVVLLRRSSLPYCWSSGAARPSERRQGRCYPRRPGCSSATSTTHWRPNCPFRNPIGCSTWAVGPADPRRTRTRYPRRLLGTRRRRVRRSDHPRQRPAVGDPKRTARRRRRDGDPRRCRPIATRRRGRRRCHVLSATSRPPGDCRPRRTRRRSSRLRSRR